MKKIHKILFGLYVIFALTVFIFPSLASALIPLPVNQGGTGVNTITGLVKGNGTAAFSAASSGTDFQSPITLTTTGTSGAATFLSNTLNIPNYTTSGGTPCTSTALSIQYNTSGSFGCVAGVTSNGTILTTASGDFVLAGASSGTTVLNSAATAGSSILTLPAGTDTLIGRATTDTLTNKDLTSGTNVFPTFNQNTTGSSAKWTTARNLAGNSVDGSANVAFSNKFIVQGTTDAGLSGAQFLGALGTGLVKNTTTTGILSIAASGTDYQLPITLTTTGTSGAATFISNTLNIPNYSTSGGTPCTTTALSLQYNASGSFGCVAGITSNGTLLNVAANDLSFTGSSSGSTLLNATGVASGTLTLPAATDTLIGKATTDTLTNKTYDTAGTGNSFKINGTAITAINGSGAVALTTSPSFVTPTIGAASGTSLNLSGLTASKVIFTDASKNLTSTGIGTSAQFIKGDGSLDSSTYITGNQTITLSGDVSGSGATAITTAIGANKVTLGMLATLAANSVIGNSTGSTATPTAVSMLNTATASSVALRDTNANLLANNFISGYTTTATAAGTTILTVGSTYNQTFTGSTTQAVTMPASVPVGQGWYIKNNSTGAITINATAAANTIVVLAAGTSGTFTSIANTASPTAASWSFDYLGISIASGKKLTVSNSLTLAGTDGTTMTFPSTSATIARTDAANTFTGVQTMTSPAITTPAITGLATGSGVASTATASTLATRDANANLSANSVLTGYTTTATAAGTTVLTVASTQQQYFTGSTTQTVTLPVASTLVLGQSFTIVNNSTGVVTVNSSGANLVKSMAAATTGTFTVILASGTTAASWSVTYVSSSTGTANAQTFLSSGTWTKPAGVTFVQVEVISGGGGGGGGATNAGTAGNGAGGGAKDVRTFLASDLGSTETLVVGTGGAGHAGTTAGNLAQGSDGTLSSFGTTPYMTAFPGLGAGNGNGATNNGESGYLSARPTAGLQMVGGQGARAQGNQGLVAEYGGGGGGTAPGTGQNSGGDSLYGAGGGGSGGNQSTSIGGQGGASGKYGNAGAGTSGSGSAGGASGATGSIGTVGATGNSTKCGGGGGGGGVGTGGAGGPGAAGGFPGGGGGGGAQGTTIGGAGGPGAAGVIYIFSW